MADFHFHTFPLRSWEERCTTPLLTISIKLSKSWPTHTHNNSIKLPLFPFSSHCNAHSSCFTEERRLPSAKIHIYAFLYVCVGWSEWVSTKWLSVYCLLKYFRSSKARAALKQPWLSSTASHPDATGVPSITSPWGVQGQHKSAVMRAGEHDSVSIQRCAHTINYNLLTSHRSWRLKNNIILNYKENWQGCSTSGSFLPAARSCSIPALNWEYLYMVQSRSQKQLTQRQVCRNVTEQSCVGVCQEQRDHTFFTPLVLVSPHRHPFPEPLSSKTLHTSTRIFLSGKQTFTWNPKNLF